MSDQPTPDWTQWIIYSLAAVVSTMFTTVVFLTKYIGNKYVDEIASLKKLMSDTDLKHKAEMDSLTKKHEECVQGHHAAEMRLIRLEEQVAQTKKQVATNTRDIQNGGDH